MRKASCSRLWPQVSRGTVAALLLAVPVAASAQGFAGSFRVVRGSAEISGAGHVQNVNIPTSSPITTINWTPTDTATSTNPINFLPATETVNYIGADGARVPYTVLNRIIPTDSTRTVAFNGAVTSTANTRVWFYSPGGLLIGPRASFDVGGLVLTTADPVAPIDPATGGPGDFVTTTAGTDKFSFAGDGTSAITIRPGARINALNSGQSNYIVAFAPQIIQGGNIAVAGSVALVAAESASFAVDNRGLFNITVSAGTTVARNTFVHTGSTGGPDADTSGSFQRVYMVAVPKNNAISMAIASSGSIGFAVADAANVDGNAIVLSAGSNIADTGSGNPVVAGPAGSGRASLTVGGGSAGTTYTSNTYAVSTGSAAITDPASGISFGSNLTVTAPRATVDAQIGTISVGGNLTVGGDYGAGGVALVQADPGASVAVGVNAAALGLSGDLTIDASDTLGGAGGNASLIANGGNITVQRNVQVLANASWGSTAFNPGGITTQGGTALIAASGGGTLTAGRTVVAQASADGSGADFAYFNQTGQPDLGIDAFAGSATIRATGAGSSISAVRIGTDAAATGGSDSVVGNGGNATGGTALITAESGGAIVTQGLSGLIQAEAAADSGGPGQQGAFGGTGTGGTAQIIANAGTITMQGQPLLIAYAGATGGTGTGTGGSAIGGNALIETQGANGMIVTNTLGDTSANPNSQISVNADAIGGDGSAQGFGGSATGGTATLATTGAGQAITLDHGGTLFLFAGGLAGNGGGGGSGSATGGTAQLLAGGGSIAITNTALEGEANASGGTDFGSFGGDATGGTIRLAASGGGTLNANGTTTLGVSASGGNGSSNGGTALGGNIFIDLGDNAFNFGSGTAAVNLDASFFGGTADSLAAPATSAGGVRVTDLGALSLAAPITLNENTPLYVQADGAIGISSSITNSGSGAYLHVWADDLGTGVGTVTLADGAVNLPGSQIDIYYNPSALGTPTDFSAGIAAGTATAYQLVDDVNQLQLVGSYLSQNFALGRNVDASATAGWNGGAGFVPIGNLATPFTGNFDGLNHTITNLYINLPNTNLVGLFGDVDAAVTGASLIIRNVGLVNAQVIGSGGVGALAGEGIDLLGSHNLVISNSYSTGGAVTGALQVGGLIGIIQSGALTNVHSDVPILMTGGFQAGGLVGGTNQTIITNAFASGSVTASPGANALGAQFVGGLIGNQRDGSLTNAYATGAILAPGGIFVGGLIGAVQGTVTQAYATGAVTAVAGKSVGGLAGNITASGSISNSWASGAVSGPTTTNAGGFVGKNQGIIANSYWDTYSTGQATGVGQNTFGSTVSNLNPVTSDPAQVGADNYAFGGFAYGNFSGGDWTYDNNMTRPVGAWETPVAQFGVATIESAHQVQLIDFNMGGSYLVTQNIDMRGTGGTTDIWGPEGFMPLGGIPTDPPLTGTLDGAGHVLSNLTMAPDGNFSDVGLVQENFGTIRNLGLANVAITDAFGQYAGALAGVNAGRITDSFATGTITLTGRNNSGIAGGLVGRNSDGFGSNGVLIGSQGSISQSYASVAVSGGVATGGLVGDNEGEILGSYANGAVSGTQAGGLVGQSTDLSGPTVSNSYWDTQLTGQSAGCGSIGYSGACSGATGLTTAQTLQSASFVGFTIDTSGGRGLPWRQYEGNTTPLLEAFLTPISVQPGSLTKQYDAQTPDVGVTTYGAQPSLTFGTAVVAGLTKNAGTSDLTYGGGLYSNQLGYDFVPSTTAGTLVITPAPLTLAAVSDTRVYDATTNSTGLVQSSGLLGQDSVTSLTQSFFSPNVVGTNGSLLSVNPSYVINDGNGGNNYTVTLQSAQGTITPAALTLAAVSDTRGYNAATDSEGAVEARGLFGQDSVSGLTQSFTSPNALGTNGSRLVVNSGYLLDDGNDGANYTVTLQSARGTITPAALTLAAVSDTRGYNATTSSEGSVQISGLFGQDQVINAAQSFASGNALGTNGSTLVVNPGYTVSDGNSGGNYTVTLQSAQGTITPAALTLAAISDTRGYNATTGSEGAVQASGLFGNDNVSSLSQSFSSANALGANGSTLVVNPGYTVNDGNDGGNYTVTLQSAQGTITPAELTLAAVSDTRVYNATRSSTGQVQVSGLFGQDGVSSLTQSFTSRNVLGANGSTLVVNPGYVVNDGNGGGNYAVVAQNARGTITPAALAITYTANPATSTYGTTPSGLTGTVSPQGLQGTDTLAAVISGTAGFTTTATARSNVGSYAITGSGLAGNSGNYSFSFAQASGNATALTIVPANLTVDVLADAQSRSYGTANPALTYTETGLANGDLLTGSLATTATVASNVGTYAITQGTLSAGTNYNLNYTGANLTVTPAGLTVTYTANPLSSIYGTVPGALRGAVGAVGLVLGQTLGSVTSGGAVFTSPAGATSDVGAYAITGSGLSANSGNYNFSFVQAPGNASALTIVARALTLTADPLSRVYGGANPTNDSATAALATATTGLVNGDTISGETVTSPATAGSGVGSYALNGSAAQFETGTASNYAITYAANLTGLSITPASATITYIASPLSSIYGNVPTGLSGIERASGLVNGDTLGGVTSGTASFATTATGQSGVGSYGIAGSGLTASTGNYSFAFVQAAGNASALTIVARALTLTADPLSRVYGGVNPTSDSATAALTTATTGLVNGDTVSSETVTSPATVTSSVGRYALNGSAAQFGNGSAANYAITYASNLTGLSITPASATITYLANPLSSIYGNAPSGLSGTERASGLVNGDTLGNVTSGAAGFATAANAQSGVGSYAITGSGLTANSGNYNFSFLQAPGNATALTVVARALTLTADPLSRVYGSANPTSDSATAALTTATTGLVNGDTVSSETVTSPATAGSGVGSYALNGSAAQFETGLGSNYEITYSANPTGLSITPASATITYLANPLSSIYGNAPSGLSGTERASGLVNGDTLGNVTSGAAGFATAANAQSVVGSYAVTGSGLTANSGNYNFSFVQAPGNASALTIVARALTLTADPLSRVYGSANPTSDSATAALTTATTGLVNGDTVSSETVTSPATAGSGVGSYALNGSAAQFETGLGSNYEITYAANPTGLSITPASATIIYLATPASSIYGNAPSGLTGSERASGLVNGDTLGSVTSGTASFATSATGQSGVGSYAITGSGLSGTSGNYSFAFAQGSGNASALTIVQRALTLTANPLSRTYGGANPTSDTVTATGAIVAAGILPGLVNGDSVSSETVTSPATVTSSVGRYALNGSAAQFGSGSAANYAITYAANPTGLSITPALATITYQANPLSSIYGNAPSGLSGSESAAGLVNGDTLAGVTSGAASYSTTATGQANVGSYGITGSGLTARSGNYDFGFVQAPGNATALTIVARALTLTADPLSRVYGGANPTSDTATAALSTATTGLVNGDSISGETVTTSASSGSGVGSYALDGSAAQFGTGLAGNYVITYAANPAGLAITPAALTLTYTAAAASSTYGQAPGELTGSTALTGLVNDDAAAAVTSGNASWTSPATATSNVGNYAITGSGIELASANYTLTGVQAPGNATALTVNPAALSITYTASPASRAYGAQNPELSGTETVTGLVNDDVLASVLSGNAGYSTTATTAANVGSYAITGNGLTGASRNYSYSFTQDPGNATALAITPAAVTITYTANPSTSIYGNVPNGLSGSERASGLVNDDTLGSVTSGEASYATTATGQSSVGSYAVTGAGLAGNSDNYSFSFAQAPGNAAALTIAPRPITVTADPQQRAVGGPDPLFTYVVTGPVTDTEIPGLVNGDTLTGRLTSTATIASPAGSYDILQGSLAASANYRLSYVGNILTVAFAATPIARVTSLIEANLPDQPGVLTPAQRRKQEAELAAFYLGLGLHPLQVTQSMINDQLVTTPPPVTEPVTSNGNSSLWSPTAP